MKLDDGRAALDAIQGDMSQHQRITHAPVTAEANRRLAAEEFTKLDQAGDFDRAISAASAAPVVPETSAERPTREVRMVDGKEYVVTRDNQAQATGRPLAHRDQELVIKGLKRLQMLLELPDTGILGAASWRDKACAVMSFHGAPIRFAFELDRLLEESTRLFGDWRVDPAREIHLT